MGYPPIEKPHRFVCVCLFSPLEHASSMVKYLKGNVLNMLKQSNPIHCDTFSGEVDVLSRLYSPISFVASPSNFANLIDFGDHLINHLPAVVPPFPLKKTVMDFLPQ